MPLYFFRHKHWQFGLSLKRKAVLRKLFLVVVKPLHLSTLVSPKLTSYNTLKKFALLEIVLGNEYSLLQKIKLV